MTFLNILNKQQLAGSHISSLFGVGTKTNSQTDDKAYKNLKAKMKMNLKKKARKSVGFFKKFKKSKRESSKVQIHDSDTSQNDGDNSNHEQTEKATTKASAENTFVERNNSFLRRDNAIYLTNKQQQIQIQNESKMGRPYRNLSSITLHHDDSDEGNDEGREPKNTTRGSSQENDNSWDTYEEDDTLPDLPSSLLLSNDSEFFSSSSVVANQTAAATIRRRRNIGLSRIKCKRNVFKEEDDTATPKEIANRLAKMRSFKENSRPRSSDSSRRTRFARSHDCTDDDNVDNKYPNFKDDEEETIGDMIVQSIRQSHPIGNSMMNNVRRISDVADARRSSIMNFSYRIRRDVSGRIVEGGRRRLSSMIQWANQYRYGSDKNLVTDNNTHYVANSRWGIILERFIVPWQPPSTEALMIVLVVFSLIMTLPLGFTRLLEGRWRNTYTLQRMYNWILSVCGYEAPFGGNVSGITYPTVIDNPDRPGIDWAFSLHLIGGVLWLVIGSLQMILTNKISRKKHRQFGYFASILFFLHMVGSMNVIYMDIMNHHTMSKVFLFQGFAQSILYFICAILAVKNGDIETHRDLMVKSYLVSIEGSGTVRLAQWLSYLVGNTFLNRESYVVFDTIQCQNQYLNASAANCVFPYAFRLQGMRLLTLYFNVLYLRTSEKANDITSRKLVREEIWEDIIFYVQTIVAILVLLQLEKYFDFDRLRDFSSKGMPIQLCCLTYYSYRIISHRLKSTKEILLMPRRNAVDKTTLDTAAFAVRRWAEEQGLQDSTRTLSSSS